MCRQMIAQTLCSVTCLSFSSASLVSPVCSLTHTHTWFAVLSAVLFSFVSVQNSYRSHHWLSLSSFVFSSLLSPSPHLLLLHLNRVDARVHSHDWEERVTCFFFLSPSTYKLTTRKHFQALITISHRVFVVVFFFFSPSSFTLSSDSGATSHSQVVQCFVGKKKKFSSQCEYTTRHSSQRHQSTWLFFSSLSMINETLVGSWS